jgi:DNA-binding MarR family transcriptional regulator
MMRKRARQYLGEETSTVETYFTFLLVARECIALSQALLAQLGLTEGKMGVLMQLHYEQSNGLTPSELAERCDVTRGTITGLLDGLERTGFIERRHYAGDRRMLTVHLTPQGNAIIEDIMPKHFRALKEMIKRANLSEEEQRQFVATLEKIRAALPALQEAIKEDGTHTPQTSA